MVRGPEGGALDVGLAEVGGTGADVVVTELTVGVGVGPGSASPLVHAVTAQAVATARTPSRTYTRSSLPLS